MTSHAARWPIRMWLTLLLAAIALPARATVTVQVGPNGAVGHFHRLTPRHPSAHGKGVKAHNDSSLLAHRGNATVSGGLDAASSTVVVSSWLVMTLMGGYADSMDKPEFRGLAECIRTALAETLSVCRSAVHVTDMSAKGGDDSLLELLEEHLRPPWRQHHRSLSQEEGVAKLAQLMRRSSRVGDNGFHRMNFTRVKAAYEVRVFPEMRVSSKDVVQRVDHLQIFSRFADLNHILVRSLIHRPNTPKPAEGVMLDDVGYGRREVLTRTALSAAELADCMEEGFLQDAREVHQYVIALCCILVLFITCAGSAIFSLKQPSLVPSRTNPLLSRTR